MPEKNIYARDALYVSEEYPWTNNINASAIHVGFSSHVPAGQSTPDCPHGPWENIGLLQFQELTLPSHYDITAATLNLHVRQVDSEEIRLWIYRNKEPFEGITVTWKTKPAIHPALLVSTPVKKEAQGRYISCDISSLLSGRRKGYMPGFGLSLLADKKEHTEILFSSNHSGYPPFLSVGYCAKKEPSPPCPPYHQTVKNIFHEEVFELCGANGPLFSPAIEVSQARTITFFIENTGSDSLEARLQISPNGTDFVDDPQTCRVEANEMKALTPYLFARYARIRADFSPACKPVQARIWCQLQTLDYIVK